MKPKLPRWFFLSIILIATFGSGIVDVLTEVVPFRPYTGVFRTVPENIFGRSSESSIVSNVAIIVLFIILVASLVRAAANQTTGIVISHTGFTPSQNLTGSPGTAPTLELYPLILAFLGLALALKYWRRSEGSGI